MPDNTKVECVLNAIFWFHKKTTHLNVQPKRLLIGERNQKRSILICYFCTVTKRQRTTPRRSSLNLARLRKDHWQNICLKKASEGKRSEHKRNVTMFEISLLQILLVRRIKSKWPTWHWNLDLVLWEVTAVRITARLTFQHRAGKLKMSTRMDRLKGKFVVLLYINRLLEYRRK